MLSAEDLYHRLIFTGGVAFGSRALDVANTESDYDVAITREQAATAIATGLISSTNSSWPLDEYFDIVPRSPNNILLRGYVPDLDIVILNNTKDLMAVKKAVASLNRLPKATITDKKQRIRLYEEALLANGWRVRLGNPLATTYLPRLLRRIKWTLKNFKN